MTNLYAPERQEGESFAAYRQRRIASKAAAAHAMGKGLNGGISSRKQLRDAMRANGTMGKRIRAADALVAAWAAKVITNWKGQLDAHGAFVLVGRGSLPDGVTDTRRKWLAGVSAQRGF